MKTLKALLVSLILASSAMAGGSIRDDDQKWSAAVEKMIAAGPTTISTLSERRVEIAKQLAGKAGRKVEVSKSEQGFRIKIQ